MSADITHASSNTTITREAKGFERMISDYENYRGGYQYEQYKKDFPQSLNGNDFI